MKIVCTANTCTTLDRVWIVRRLRIVNSVLSVSTVATVTSLDFSKIVKRATIHGFSKIVSAATIVLAA